MAAPAYAPELSAIELVILNQLKDSETMVSVVKIRSEINFFEPWREMKPNKVHYWIDKLVERGMIAKSLKNNRSQGVMITATGIENRRRAGRFFRQITT